MSIRMDDKVFEICAWCKKHIPEDDEVFGIGGTFPEDSELKQKDGEKVTFDLQEAGEPVAGFAPPFYADARQDGKDVLFMLCSEECAQALKDAFSKESTEWFSTLEDILH
ncbi:MAG TPA: hypothetical protein VKA68_01465 [bacterium]|nr:hypothetical protein [bacterium]